VSLSILLFRKPKSSPTFQTPLLKKVDGYIPHEKCPFLLNMDFLVKEITNLTSNFI
jgi:hypothetical protein